MRPRPDLKEQARKDLEHILQRIDLDNPEASRRFLDAFYKALDVLYEFPLLGPLHHHPSLRSRDIRTKTIGGYENYLIFYHVLPDRSVEVLSVFHVAQEVLASSV